MPAYDVHIYATVRIEVAGVVAGSEVEACRRALGGMDAGGLLRKRFAGAEGRGAVRGVEFADEITGFLVDRAGDVEYRESRFIEVSEAGSGAARG